MPGRIYYIDLVIFVFYRAIFRINCNAAFSFYRITIHDAIHLFFVFPKYSALIQKSIHQSRFPCINVRNYGYINYF